MLQNFGNGNLVPNMGDAFPKIVISPDLRGMSGILLDLDGLHDLELGLVVGKLLYRCFVKILNKVALNEKKDTVARKVWVTRRG